MGDPGSKEASDLALLSLHRGAKADGGLRTVGVIQVGTRHGTCEPILPQDLGLLSSSSFLSQGPGGVLAPSHLPA